MDYLPHYAYHVGQIVLLSKMILGERWESLSIAKGESVSYNQKKFEADNDGGYFTDEFLEGT